MYSKPLLIYCIEHIKYTNTLYITFDTNLYVICYHLIYESILQE